MYFVLVSLLCCVLTGLYDSIITDAMIQVWGCLATSPMRCQRIQEAFASLSNHSSYTATDTHLFSDQVHVFIYPFFYFYLYIWWCEFLCWEWFYVSSRLGISRSWFAGGISRVMTINCTIHWGQCVPSVGMR